MKTGIDQLLDLHQKRLSEDLGYQAIWNNVMVAAPEHRLLAAMNLWAQQSETLRSMVRCMLSANAQEKAK